MSSSILVAGLYRATRVAKASSCGGCGCDLVEAVEKPYGIVVLCGLLLRRAITHADQLVGRHFLEAILEGILFRDGQAKRRSRAYRALG